MLKKIANELKNHFPFTALAVFVSILIVVFIQYFLRKEISKEGFHIFHFLHIVASAMVTGALYYKYKPNLVKAFFIGVLGAITIGSLSDVVFPYLGTALLNIHIHFHLPLIEESFQTLLFAFVGSAAGIIVKRTKIPHFIHVFLSVFASLFYILVFSSVFQPVYFLGAFFIVFIAVIIPCCISDIVFPLIFVNSKKNDQSIIIKILKE